MSDVNYIQIKQLQAISAAWDQTLKLEKWCVKTNISHYTNCVDKIASFS